tara:strand:- start:2045 stop:3145 length:1101 start_codon:yes stop_codon:yes gene_type:complete
MYTRFGENDIVNRQAQELVTSTWSNNLNNLQNQHTASTCDFTTATSSGQFYIEVLNDNQTSSVAETQYFLSYGNRHGSGSVDFTNDTGSFGLGASRVIYNQYRQLHYNDDTKFFTFGNHTPEDIFVINIARGRYKQRLTLGSLNLHISGTAYGGTAPAQNKIHLTDDSVTNPAGAGNSNLGTYYNLVSGSNGIVSGSVTNQLTISGESATFGHVYPEAGLIIINGDAFSSGNSAAHSPAPVRGQASSGNTDRNHLKLFHHISQIEGAVPHIGGPNGHFIVDTTEEINSEFYFARARNDQFNYTNNESFVDANKNIRFETMQLNPKVFITTIGLYNDAFELVAVAKLSQPVAKDFTKEALIRVKLDY